MLCVTCTYLVCELYKVALVKCEVFHSKTSISSYVCTCSRSCTLREILFLYVVNFVSIIVYILDIAVSNNEGLVTVENKIHFFECFKEFGLKWFHVLAIILDLMWINIRVESFLRLFFSDCFIRISEEFLLFMTYDNFKILKNITKHLGINVNFHHHCTIWGFVYTILP